MGRTAAPLHSTARERRQREPCPDCSTLTTTPAATPPLDAQEAASAILQASCSYINSKGVDIAFLAVGNDAAAELRGEAAGCGPEEEVEFNLSPAYAQFAREGSKSFCGIRHGGQLGITLHIPKELENTAKKVALTTARAPALPHVDCGQVEEALRGVVWQQGAFRGYAGEQSRRCTMQ